MARLYRAFGTILQSDVALGELQEAPAGSVVPTRFLKVASGGAPDIGEAVLVGAEDIAYGAHVELYRVAPGRYRLAYSDTGTFDISAPEGTVSWFRPESCEDDLAAMDILGRVLATLLHAEGTITLHASAAEIDGRAIGFMAPKFHGKSTIAAALTHIGARLVSDDALAILPGSPVRCVPGVPSVRLRQESAAHFPRTQALQAPDLPHWRVVYTPAPEQIAVEPLELAALYELVPRDSAAGADPVRRTPMPSMEAMLALTRYAKMGTLLGDREGHEHVTRVVDVISTVPTYSLDLVRDLQQLDDVVRTVASWHRISDAPPGSQASQAGPSA